MAVDLSARICTNCKHASLCPHREEMMAFYQNRDKVMVKCANDDGTIDTSESVSIRIEHRYLDGPGLEELYKQMNLGGAGWYPCQLPNTGCPFLRHPFDTPIFAPYPNPVGYIEPLCRGARDAVGNRLQYIAPVAPPRTNEYHVSPYPTYKGMMYTSNWSCSSCAQKDQCSGEVDYAKLGGTVYSTFGITYVDSEIGGTIVTADIATPDTVMGGYERVSNTPDAFEVDSETNVFIIYYTYVGDQKEPTDYHTEEELKKEKLLHRMEFFYGGRTFAYPSSTANPAVAMGVSILGATCVTNPRQKEDGTVLCAPYDFIPVRSNGTGIFVYDYDGVSSTDTANDRKNKALDVSNVNYQTSMELVEGDIVQIQYVFDKKWKLDAEMMKLMNYGIDLIPFEVSEVYMTGDLVQSTLTFPVPKGDFTVQTCLVKRSYQQDPVNYPGINYVDYWEPDQIMWGRQQVAVTIQNEVVMANQPIPPRKWSNNLTTDSMPFYATNYPPDDASIVRPYFNLLGYTDQLENRYTFDDDTKIFTAEEMEYEILATNSLEEIRSSGDNALLTHKTPSGATVSTRMKTHEQRFYMKKNPNNEQNTVTDESFLVTDVDMLRGGAAMWKLDPEKIEAQIIPVLTAVDPNLKVTETIPSVVIEPSDMLENWDEEDIADPYMDEIYPATQMEWSMPYMPNNALRLLQSLRYATMPDNFQFSLFRIPSNVENCVVWSTWPENESITDHDPHATIKLKDGTEVQLSDYKVTDTSEFPDELDCTYLLVVQPIYLYGMTKYYQNFKMYQIHVTQTRHEVSLTAIFDGSKMGLRMPPLDQAKELRLMGVYPADQGQVAISINENVIDLTGDRAPFYVLSNTMDLQYLQTVTTNCTYDNACQSETVQYEVGYRDAYTFDFAIPNGHSIVKIEVDGTVLYEIVDGERVDHGTISLADGMGAYLITDSSGSVMMVAVTAISKDFSIDVTYHIGNDGSIEGCDRCKGYVDTSTRDWLEWLPICLDFESM